MNKKILLFAAVFMTAAAILAGCGSQQEQKTAKDTLVIGMEPTFPPFEFTEGDTYVGFDIDYSKAIAEKMGKKAEIKSLGFDALIPALQSGQIDMIASGMDATPERKEQVNFTDIYFKGGYTVVVKKDNMTINGFDDLTGKTVGAQVGTKAVDYAQEHGAVVKQFDQNTQGWMELEAGTCDAVVIDNAVAMYYLQQGGSKELKMVGEPIISTGMSLAVSKDDPQLLEKVNNAMAELKSDGTYAELYKKWFGTEPKI